MESPYWQNKQRVVYGIDPKELYLEIRDTLRSTEEAQSGSMFGMPCLKIGGKAFAGFYQDHMIFKLRGQRLDDAIALEESKLFDPMGGRPMKEWVQVPCRHGDHWEELAKQALSLQREANSRSSR